MDKVQLCFVPLTGRWRILINGKAIPRRFADRATAIKEFERQKRKAEGVKKVNKMGKSQLMCSLCGTLYSEKRGHSLSDCWGLLHQALIEADRVARGLRHKLEEAQRRIDNAKKV